MSRLIIDADDEQILKIAEILGRYGIENRIVEVKRKGAGVEKVLPQVREILAILTEDGGWATCDEVHPYIVSRTSIGTTSDCLAIMMRQGLAERRRRGKKWEYRPCPK